MATNRGPTHWAVLRERNLVWFVASRFFSGAAMTLLRATVAWQVFALTGSAFSLGLIGLVHFIPTLLLSLVAGAVADSYERRRIVLLTLTTTLAGSATLYLAGTEDAGRLVLVYAVILAVAVAYAFEGPARAAMLPALVSPAQFPSAVTLHSTVQNIAWAAGPLSAGFVISWAGVRAAFLLHAALVLVAVATMARVHPPAGARGRGTVTLAAIREGLHFVRRRQVVLGAMTLDMLAVIFAGATALLPIYADEILHVGPRGYGLLGSALEIGTLSMGLALLFRPPIQRPGRALLIAVAVFGLATIVFGLSRSFPLSVTAFIVAGMADQVSMVTRSMIIQLATPDELRGRVSSVNLIFIGASNQLGAVESGFVAALTSATFAVVSGGAACLVALAIAAVRLPALGRYRLGGPAEE
jgi:MFS family permease